MYIFILSNINYNIVSGLLNKYVKFTSGCVTLDNFDNRMFLSFLNLGRSRRTCERFIGRHNCNEACVIFVFYIDIPDKGHDYFSFNLLPS